MQFRPRLSAALLVGACMLLPQLALMFPLGKEGEMDRLFFLASDVPVAVMLVALSKSVRWRLAERVSAVRLGPTIIAVILLRRWTTGFGDGLYLLGYVPAWIILGLISVSAIVLCLALDGTRTARRRQT